MAEATWFGPGELGPMAKRFFVCFNFYIHKYIWENNLASRNMKMPGQSLSSQCPSFTAGLCWGIPEEHRGLRVETMLYSKMSYSKTLYRHCSLTLLLALLNPVSTSEIFLQGVTPTVIKKLQGSPICVLWG